MPVTFQCSNNLSSICSRIDPPVKTMPTVPLQCQQLKPVRANWTVDTNQPVKRNLLKCVLCTYSMIKWRLALVSGQSQLAISKQNSLLHMQS
jgi:hypothetical protein